MSLRSRLTRVLAAAGLVLVTSVVPIAEVAACDCMMLAPADAAAAADVAFTGTVVAEKPVAAGGQARIGVGVGETLYAFEVDGVAKGEVSATAEVLSGGDGASCGMTFGVGERWLVFGTFERDTITTHLCSGNVGLAPGDPPPIPVTAPRASAAQDDGPRIPLAIVLPALVVGAVAAASAILFWRADRPS